MYMYLSPSISVSLFVGICVVVCNLTLLYLTNSDKLEYTIPSFKNEYYKDQFALSFSVSMLCSAHYSLLVKKYNDLQ